MRVLIVGASGLVGSHVYNEAIARGHEVVGTYCKTKVKGLTRLDLCDDTVSVALLNKFCPEWVIHAAGWTWVDGCEIDPKRAFRENCEQPVQLARLCRATGARFAYFSTTYVFDGKEGPYSEEDAPNPINVYGKSKWTAEQKIQEILNGEALIPRTICVWGREVQEKNFLYQVLMSVRENRVMRLPSDQFGNPSWAGDIAWWLWELISCGERGCWNLAGLGENASRVEWYYSIRTALIRAGFPENFPIPQEVPTSVMGQIAPRPLHSGAIIRKITNRFNRVPRAPDNLIGLGIIEP